MLISSADPQAKQTQILSYLLMPVAIPVDQHRHKEESSIGSSEQGKVMEKSSQTSRVPYLPATLRESIELSPCSCPLREGGAGSGVPKPTSCARHSLGGDKSPFDFIELGPAGRSFVSQDREVRACVVRSVKLRVVVCAVQGPWVPPDGDPGGWYIMAMACPSSPARADIEVFCCLLLAGAAFGLKVFGTVKLVILDILKLYSSVGTGSAKLDVQPWVQCPRMRCRTRHRRRNPQSWSRRRRRNDLLMRRD